MNSKPETRIQKLPSHARAVIIGGGIAGCSTAYHLAKLGWKDVVLLERKNISGGTTWHAAGLVTQLRNSRTLIDIARSSIDLYDRITGETGVETGFNRTGSISVARTQGRMDEFRKIASLGRSYGIEIEPISPGEAGEMWPMMRIDDLVGGLYIPRDAQMVPHLAAAAMARGAEMAGASLFENVSVTGILQDRGAVTGVSTDMGDIACDYVVIAAGMWSKDLGLSAGVKVPLMAAEHMYLVTRPMGLPHDAKSLRDPDEQIYFRRDQEEKGAILMGGFESAAKPWPDGPHDGYNFSLVEPDWEHFKVFWENAIYRVPQMEEAGVDRFYVSAESFTPDNRYILGEAPELRNMFLCTGLNSTGIAAGPGSGRAVAEWMVEGHPTMDLWEVDARRFHQYQNGRKYLYDRTVESVGTLYGMHWPHKQMETARMARRSPLHDRLAAHGACFGEAGGWERPNWFAPDGVEPRYEYSYGRQNWFDYSAAEHRAVREAVGLFDQTSFAKFTLQGSDAVDVLQQLCANEVDVPPGRVVYTAMLNERGGIEADLTVTRISEDSYLIVTGGAVSARDYGWIESNIPAGADARLTDVTSAYAVLGLMGPHSRDLLSDVTDSDASTDAMPFLSSREITIGYAPVRATRITYVGELGWELYMPSEFASGVFDTIMARGEEHGLRLAGFHAMESLRVEKAYRAWGHDIVDLDTPLEAGLGFAVAMDKPSGFIGRDALLQQQSRGLTRRLAVFLLDDPQPLLLGDEPIFRDGRLVGRTTSGAFGHTVGSSVGMGYVESEEPVTPRYVRSGSYEIEVLAQRFTARARLSAPYDARGRRVRE